MRPVRVSVIHRPATGHVAAPAAAVAQGAREAGVAVRARRFAETTPA